MKNWSIRRILQTNAIVSILLLGLLGATAFFDMMSLKNAVDHGNHISNLSRKQLHADMMHDAIRSDVLSSIMALEKGQMEKVAEIKNDFKEHSTRLITDLQQNAQAETNNPKVAPMATKVITTAQRYVKTADSLVDLGEYDAFFVEQLSSSFNKDFAQLEVEMEKLTDLIAEQSEAALNDAENTLQKAYLIMGLLLALSLTITLIVSYSVIKSITGPLKRTIKVLNQIEQSGNLTLRAPVEGKNEISVLTSSFNSLMNAQQAIVRDVRQAAKALSENSHVLANAAEQSLTASESSNDTATTVAAAVEELSVSIAHMSDQAEDAHQASRESRRLSETSAEAIEQSSREMREISATVHESSRTIRELEQAVLQISSIAKVIDEIAEQTNLLALNAAIEAARAGEQGRGFAVVADEVRNLAERTSQSTKEIATTIDLVQKGTTKAVESMAEGVRRVEAGEAMSEQARQSMAALAEDAKRAAEAISQITASLMEQKAVGHDIGKAVEKVAQIAEEGKFIAGDTSKRASALNELATNLGSQVNRFTT